MNRTKEQDATYHCGIGGLLRAAYGREFSMLEMGKCKTKFPVFGDWYKTLNIKQQKVVDAHLDTIYGLP